MFGIRSSKIREKLITTGSDFTLAKATDIANLYELSRIQLKTMNEETKENSVRNESEVNRIEKEHPHRGRQSEFETGRNCGRRKHERSEKCPAIGKVWLGCGEKNHFERVCEFSASKYGANSYSNYKLKRGESSRYRGKSAQRGRFQRKHPGKPKRRSVNMLTESDEDDSECENSLFLGMINLDVNTIENWTTTLQVGDTEVQFLMDTGAKCNVLTRDTYNKLNIIVPLEKPEASLTSYSGHIITTDGMVSIPLQYNGHVNSVKFYVVHRKAPNILGAETCRKLDLVRCMNTINKAEHVHSNSPANDILREPQYAELFEGFGCLARKYSIKLDPSVTPTILPPRKVPISLKDKVHQELRRMEQLGVIERHNRMGEQHDSSEQGIQDPNLH